MAMAPPGRNTALSPAAAAAEGSSESESEVSTSSLGSDSEFGSESELSLSCACDRCRRVRGLPDHPRPPTTLRPLGPHRPAGPDSERPAARRGLPLPAGQ